MAIQALAAASEWAMPKVGGLGGEAGTGGGVDDATGGSGGGFGGMLADQLEGLANLQKEAAGASRSLADGTAADPSQVVVAVERAQLSMQLAAQLRTKAVDAVTEVFRTQI